MSVTAMVAIGALFAAVFAAVGGLWGLLYRWLWTLVHGADRTPRAARAITLSALAVQLASAALLLAYGDGDAQLAAVIVAPWLLGLVPYGLALYAVLRKPPVPTGGGAEPPDLVQDHDGVSFSVPWHAAGVSAVVLVLAVAMPLPMAFAAIAWSRSYRRTTVRIRNDAVAVGGDAASLHGARLEDAVRADGTPVLRVVADRVLELPLGGTPPAEVAWLRDTLAAAIREAEDTRLPPQPEALRRLRVQQ
jgi:hypothetical protein